MDDDQQAEAEPQLPTLEAAPPFLDPRPSPQRNGHRPSPAPTSLLNQSHGSSVFPARTPSDTALATATYEALFILGNALAGILWLAIDDSSRPLSAPSALQPCY